MKCFSPDYFQLCTRKRRGNIIINCHCHHSSCIHPTHYQELSFKPSEGCSYWEHILGGFLGTAAKLRISCNKAMWPGCGVLYTVACKTLLCAHILLFISPRGLKSYIYFLNPPTYVIFVSSCRTARQTWRRSSYLVCWVDVSWRRNRPRISRQLTPHNEALRKPWVFFYFLNAFLTFGYSVNSTIIL